MLLNNPLAKGKIKMEIRKYFEWTENETQDIKICRQKLRLFIGSVCTRKEERSQINYLTFHFKNLGKIANEIPSKHKKGNHKREESNEKKIEK